MNIHQALLCLLLIRHSNSYEVLVSVADVCSHLISFGKLAEHLRMRGHGVTLLLPSNMEIPSDLTEMGVKTIYFGVPNTTLNDRDDYKTLAKKMAYNPSFLTRPKVVQNVIDITMATGYYFFEDRIAMESVQNIKFDVVIIDPDFLPHSLIPYKLGIPYAFLGSNCFHVSKGVSGLPSHVPHDFSPHSDCMSFWERLANLFMHINVPFSESEGLVECRKYVPDRPSVDINKIVLNASLCLQLRENVIDFIRPEMPDVIPIANLMAKESKPLLPELELYMDNSIHGVIYISFGTIVGEIPQETITKIFAALHDVKYDILFKYTNENYLENVPPNVKLVSWVPQNEVLAHPNLKLFITHCGMNSVLEIFYHGVPVIGMPHAYDQFTNAALLKARGFGEMLTPDDFTSEEFYEMIDRVITDEEYLAKAKQNSII